MPMETESAELRKRTIASPSTVSTLLPPPFSRSRWWIPVSIDKDLPFQRDTSYQWCIAYTSNSGRDSLPKCGRMRTSLLSSTALESAAIWIGSNDSSAPINQVRYEFLLPTNVSPVRATAFICGIGYNQLWINGRQVDPTRQLDPTWTTYERTLYYTSFDVLPFIQPAGNAVGVNLGGGWFSQSMHYAWQLPKPNYGPPRMIFLMNIVMSDGSILNVTSHTGWTGRTGPIQSDHIYHGEFRDGRFERNGWSNYSFVDRRSLWRAVDAVVSPGGSLRLQPLNPIRSGPNNLHVKVNQSSTNPAGVVGAPIILPDGFIHAANVSQPIRSVFIVDFGQNFAGFIRIFMKGTPGWPLVIRYGEALLNLPADASTHVLQASFRGATQSDTYILRGDADGEWYQPTNTYHGFRYISIFRPFGDFTVDQVIGIPIHTETSLIGRFVSSSAILNQIQHNLQYGMLSQAMGIFSDCPSRDERMGWMDDLLLTSDQGMYNFDLAQFYSAFLDNMDDAQLPNFNYPDTTPMMLGRVTTRTGPVLRSFWRGKSSNTRVISASLLVIIPTTPYLLTIGTDFTTTQDL